MFLAMLSAEPETTQLHCWRIQHEYWRQSIFRFGGGRSCTRDGPNQHDKGRQVGRENIILLGVLQLERKGLTMSFEQSDWSNELSRQLKIQH